MWYTYTFNGYLHKIITSTLTEARKMHACTHAYRYICSLLNWNDIQYQLLLGSPQRWKYSIALIHSKKLF